MATRRKMLTLNADVVAALQRWSAERDVALEELADEAFRDLLKKHCRPLTLRDALGQSVRTVAANEQNGAEVHRLPRKVRRER